MGGTGESRLRWSTWRRTFAVAGFVGVSGVVCDSAIDGLQRFSLDVGFPDFPVTLRLLLGSLVVSALIGLLASITGRLWLSTGIMLTLSTTLGFFNGLKLDLRFEPLYPGDISMAGESSSIMKMIGWGPLAAGLLLAAATTLIALLTSRICGSTVVAIEMAALWRGPDRHWARGLALVLSLATLACAAVFHAPGNPLRRAYLATGSTWSGTSQAAVYADEGFIGATLENLDPVAMQRPPGYSKATMRQLQARYTALAARTNQARAGSPLRRMNVVVVLSESFADPTRLKGLTLRRDPLPFTHRLMKRTLSGAMLSPGYGGGTANVEFEALTGFSMSQFLPSLTYPYSMLVAGRSRFPSAVDYFVRNGHRAVAIHPHLGSFYSRDRVYPVLGFAKFTTQDDMHFKATDGHQGFISDEAAFKEVEYELANEPRPAFVHLVTMQNHGPYANRYPKPETSGASGGPGAEIGNYLVGLRHSDAALRRFIAHLRELSEPTAVIFFGDHQPGIWPSSVAAASGRERMFETPYFIWCNAKQAPTKDGDITSPIYFMPTLFDLVNAPVPPFLSLLAAMKAHVAAMDSGMILDQHNEPLSPEALSPSARRLLSDYRLVQYDVTQGQHYLPEPFFAAAP